MSWLSRLGRLLSRRRSPASRILPMDPREEQHLALIRKSARDRQAGYRRAPAAEPGK